MHGDRNLPIYDVRNSGLTYSEAIRILLDGDKSLVCHRQPIIVENNCLFLVNLPSLDDPDDIKSDDCGHWVHNGRKSTCVAVTFQNKKIVDVKSVAKPIPPDENSVIHCLVRTYYIHDPHSDFKRIFYHIYGMLLVSVQGDYNGGPSAKTDQLATFLQFGATLYHSVKVKVVLADLSD